jgi:hypothetical protein
MSIELGVSHVESQTYSDPNAIEKMLKIMADSNQNSGLSALCPKSTCYSVKFVQFISWY